MAKKKNAPVLKNNLRNKPAEKFRTVNRMNGIVTMVEYSSEDDIKAYELEPTFRELGGGGSSDFSTATVTVTSELDTWVLTLALPWVFDNAEAYGYGTYIYPNVTIGSESDYTPNTIVLYKNCAVGDVFLDSGLTVNVSGNATYSNNQITVTGDCTITVIEE